MVELAAHSDKNIYYVFLVVPLSFEDQARRELEYQILNSGLSSQMQSEILNSIQIIKGGIEFKSELQFAAQLNHVLKIPVRILLRFEAFSASDFPKLFKRTQRLPWKDFIPTQLDANIELDIEVSAHESRLNIKKRIADSVNKGVFKVLEENTKNNEHKRKILNPKKVYTQKIFVRIVKNICTISLDMSGEALYKRSYKVLTAQAPLRENLAAGLLQVLCEGLDLKQKYELLDPMMGSGSFLLEALTRNQFSSQRDYSYQHWPIVKSVQKNQNSQKVNLAPMPLVNFESFQGIEIHKEALEMAKENFSKNKFLVNTHLRDFRNLSDENLIKPTLTGQNLVGAQTALPRLVISNAPYGERIKVSTALSKYYPEIVLKCAENFKPLRMGFILSQKVSVREIKVPEHYKLKSVLNFQNGGLPVYFAVFERN